MSLMAPIDFHQLYIYRNKLSEKQENFGTHVSLSQRLYYRYLINTSCLAIECLRYFNYISDTNIPKKPYLLNVIQHRLGLEPSNQDHDDQPRNSSSKPGSTIFNSLSEMSYYMKKFRQEQPSFELSEFIDLLDECISLQKNLSIDNYHQIYYELGTKIQLFFDSFFMLT